MSENKLKTSPDIFSAETGQIILAEVLLLSKMSETQCEKCFAKLLRLLPRSWQVTDKRMKN